jgi:signal transduction histidine kinase
MRTVAAGQWESTLSDAAADGRLGLARAFHEMAAALGSRERAQAEVDRRLRSEMETRSRRWDEANRDLLAAEARRTQFLADVSHQLRTPLTILRGEADLALRGRPRVADLRQALGRIETQADEMRQLLEDLVAYARTEAESRLHEPAPIQLDQVIGAAVNEGRALAEQREVSILANASPEGLLVNGDARRLKQALLIGLDNAVKHSPPGGHIDVEAGRSGGDVTIRIVDDGPGVDPIEQPRVFERFFRGRAEAELLNEGLGIGLPIAKQIIERHGGSIALENQQGRGAVLEIRLPAASEVE